MTITLHYIVVLGKTACGDPSKRGTTNIAKVQCKYCKAALEAFTDKIRIILGRLSTEPAVMFCITEGLRGRQVRPSEVAIKYGLAEQIREGE